jgi:hypothetical protein
VRPHIDWVTTEGCPECWWYGPHIMPRYYDAHGLHVAWHEFCAAILAPVDRWLTAALGRWGR